MTDFVALKVELDVFGHRWPVPVTREEFQRLLDVEVSRMRFGDELVTDETTRRHEDLSLVLVDEVVAHGELLRSEIFRLLEDFLAEVVEFVDVLDALEDVVIDFDDGRVGDHVTELRARERVRLVVFGFDELEVEHERGEEFDPSDLAG